MDTPNPSKTDSPLVTKETNTPNIIDPSTKKCTTTPLMKAIRDYNFDLSLKYMKSCDINAQTTTNHDSGMFITLGDTALHIASRRNSCFLPMLRRRGALWNIRNNNGRTAIEEAVTTPESKDPIKFFFHHLKGDIFKYTTLAEYHKLIKERLEHSHNIYRKNSNDLNNYEKYWSDMSKLLSIMKSETLEIATRLILNRLL